jgi:hypothetical protein
MKTGRLQQLREGRPKARNNAQAAADEIIIPRLHKARLFKVQAVAVGAEERRREAAGMWMWAEYLFDNKLCARKEVVLFSTQCDRTIMSGGGGFKKHLVLLLSFYLFICSCSRSMAMPSWEGNKGELLLLP